MRLAGFIGVLAALSILAGCSTAFERMRALEPVSGRDFASSLATEYRTLAIQSAEDNRQDVANRFAEKSIAATRGELVLPDDVDGLPKTAPRELIDDHVRLLAMLDGGIRETCPRLLAKAQSAFDCWLIETKKESLGQQKETCHRDFQSAMADIMFDPVPPPANSYAVLFDAGSATITAPARRVLQLLLENLHSRDWPTLITITARADRSGPEAYNLALSVRRAETVAQHLIADGIDASLIRIVALGEGDNAVGTADGVKEPANRQVEINLRDGKPEPRVCR